MAFQRVDIAGGQVSGVSDLSSVASSVINFDVDEAGVNWPRPALTTYSLTGARSVGYNGATAWDQYLVLMHTDGYLVVVRNSTPTVATVVSTSTSTTQVLGGERPTFVAARDYVYAAAGHQIVRWAPSLAAAETLTSSPRCTHIASHGNYLIANSLEAPHTWVWSDIGEGSWSTWPAANSTTAAARPDPVVAVGESLTQVTVWGSQSMQTYQLGTDPTLPFDLINSIDLGLGAPYAFCRGDDSWWMLDHHKRIVKCDGTTYTPISDAIQKDIKGFSDVSDCWMYRVEQGQFSRLVVRFPTAERTFVYDLKRQAWREDRYYSAPFQSDMPVGAYADWSALGYHILGSDSSTGGLFRLDDTVRVENGTVPIVCDRVGGWSDFGTKNRKRFGATKVVMKRGASTDPDISDQGALEIRVQDDQEPWSDWIQINVGDPTGFEPVVTTYDLQAVATQRRTQVRYSSSESTAIAEVQMDVSDLGVP